MRDTGKHPADRRVQVPAFLALTVSAMVWLIAPDLWARYDPAGGMDVGLTVLWVAISGAAAYAVASAALFALRRARESRRSSNDERRLVGRAGASWRSGRRRS